MATSSRLARNGIRQAHALNALSAESAIAVIAPVPSSSPIGTPICGQLALWAVGCYLRMLTARATTRATVTIEMAACTVMAIFAQRDSGMTSVGLKAAALVNDRYR